MKKSLQNVIADPIPDFIPPMLATLSGKAFDSEDWIYEIKWDGYRTLAFIEGSDVRLVSRNNQNFNRMFNSIVHSLEDINFNCVLDGEIVVLDENGHPSFNLIQQYKKKPQGNLIYYIFDILFFQGQDLRDLPLIHRKNILQSLPLPEISNIKVVSYIEKEGKAFFKAALKMNLEGIIAKKASATYQSGRSSSWLKIKNYNDCEAIIIGYTEGSRKKYFGAILLGYYRKGKLVYTGRSGTGFSMAKEKELYDKFQELRTDSCPVSEIPSLYTRNAVWLKPELVCRVQYQEVTRDGLLRQCAYKYIVDKNAKEITAIC